MALNPWGLVEDLFKFGQGQWFNGDNSLVILSSGYYETTDLLAMMKGFSLVIWLIILSAIIVLATYYYTSEKIIPKYHGNKSVSHIVIRIMAPLINQNIYKKRDIVFTLWSLMCLILANCFSNNILYSILNQEFKVINTLQELVDSKMTVIIPGDSWITGAIAEKPIKDPYLKILAESNRIIHGDANNNDVSNFKLILPKSKLYYFISLLKIIYPSESLHLSGMVIMRARYIQRT